MPTSGNIRILGFIKRRPDLTEEQFYEHWEKVHGPLVAPWAVKHGFVSYSQIHTRSGLRAQWSATLGPGKDAFDFDGAGTFEVKSLEQFLKACQDPYFHEIILKDELNFLNKTQTVMATNTMGLNVDFVVGGKAVMGGTNSEMVLTE